MNSVCKMCTTIISNKRIYCCNKCKFLDKDYNLKRSNKLKKQKTWAHICEMCGWGTNDSLNKSGSLFSHYTKVHSYTREQFYKAFPQIPVSARYLAELTSTTSDIECKICNKKMHKISNTHLKLHGITTIEYKELYETNIISSDVKKKQSISNINMQLDAIFNGARCGVDTIPLFSHEEYIGVENRKLYKFKCKKCNLNFEDHLDDGHMPRCPQCTPNKSFSPTGKAQSEVMEYIKSIYTGTVLANSRTIIPPKEIDIVLPDIKVGIEYNGLYWHSEQFVGKSYHKDKMLSARKAGYHLIQIFEDEWENSKDIVKNKICNILGGTPNKIYARNTKLKSVPREDAMLFLQKNHIQGCDKHKFAYGLYNEDELVFLCTFVNPRVALGKKINSQIEIELSRMCSLLGTRVVGGAQKIIKHFIKNNSNITLYSYADLRYTAFDENVYKKCGFTKTSEGSPGYWYFINGKLKRYHRFNFTKRKTIEMGGDPNKTEWENMISLGYNRIWDCGHLKYELTI